MQLEHVSKGCARVIKLSKEKLFCGKKSLGSQDFLPLKSLKQMSLDRPDIYAQGPIELVSSRKIDVSHKVCRKDGLRIPLDDINCTCYKFSEKKMKHTRILLLLAFRPRSKRTK